MNATPSSNYYSILKQLQEVDVILADLSIYLDTYPEDSDAILQINHYYQKRKKLVDFYEKKYCPLFNRENISSNLLVWRDVSWKWQI